MYKSYAMSYDRPMDTDELLAELHAVSLRDLLRTAYMLTHQMERNPKLRAMRDIITDEVARRCGE